VNNVLERIWEEAAVRSYTYCTIPLLPGGNEEHPGGSADIGTGYFPNISRRHYRLSQRAS
jgi:hypothetical protein